jgi:hypothetical protein
VNTSKPRALTQFIEHVIGEIPLMTVPEKGIGRGYGLAAGLLLLLEHGCTRLSTGMVDGVFLSADLPRTVHPVTHRALVTLGWVPSEDGLEWIMSIYFSRSISEGR